MRLPSLTREMRRHGWTPGRPLTLEQVYAANTVTQEELDAWREEEAWREKARLREYAERRRREREGRWADEAAGGAR